MYLLVTFVSPAETAEPIKMPFGETDLDGHREPCIRWGPDTQGEGQYLGCPAH